MPGRRRVSALQKEIVRLTKQYECESYQSFGVRLRVIGADEIKDRKFIAVGQILGADVEACWIEFSGEEEWRYWVKMDESNNVLVLPYPMRITAHCMTDWVTQREMFLQQCDSSDTSTWSHPDEQYQFYIRNLHQKHWWAGNGRTFNFLGLPRELRDEIYKFCIGDPIRPCPRPLVRPEEKRYIKPFSFHSLFTVNRQIGEEISQQCSGYVKDDMKIAMETKREFEAKWALEDQQRLQDEAITSSGPSTCKYYNNGGNDGEDDMNIGDGEARVSGFTEQAIFMEPFEGDLMEFSSDEESISDLITFSDGNDIGDLMFFDEE